MFLIFLHPFGCHIASSRRRVVLSNDCTYDICCTLFVFCPLRALIGSIKTLVHHYLYQSDICTLRAEDSCSPQGSIMTSLRVSISNALRRSHKKTWSLYIDGVKGEKTAHRRHESLRVPKRLYCIVVVTHFMKRI